MEDIKCWILEICVFSAVVSLYKLLLPNGNVKRAGEIVFSLLMLLVLVSPLAKFQKSSFSSGAGTEFGGPNDVQEESFAEAALYERAVCKAVREALKRKQIPCFGVQARTNIGEASDIVISDIEVVVQSELPASQIRDWLSGAIGVPAEIVRVQRQDHEER